MSTKINQQPKTLPKFIQEHINTFSRDTELYNLVATYMENGMMHWDAVMAVADGTHINWATVRAAYYRLKKHLDQEDQS